VTWFLRVSAVAAVAALVAVVPACRNKDSGKITIGVVTNCTADFWSICEAGANKAAKEFDVNLQFRQPEKPFDAALQMQIVEAWAKQGVNGMAVSVIDPDAQTEDLTRISKKLPLITMDNDADKTGRRGYIGIDNYEAGKAVGRLVRQAIGDRATDAAPGTVAIFIGSTKSANGQGRTQGVLDALAAESNAQGTPGTHPSRPDLRGRFFGKYFVVDASSKQGGATGAAREDGGPNNAQPTVSGVLGRVKGLQNLCMVGLYAYNPPAILEVAKSKSMAGEIKIVGFDEDWETLKGIAAGEIYATVVQDPFMYGYRSVEALAAIARGDESKPKKLLEERIPYRIVTRDGGADQEVETPAGKLSVKNVKEAEFTAKLRADLDSAKIK
jgi:ribose transport system substrate-binding protein